MFDTDPTDLAIRGERGIDLFQRLESPGHKRARFRCIAMLCEPGPGAAPDAARGGDEAARIMDFEPQATRSAASLMARVQALRDNPALSRAFVLGDTRGWAGVATAGDPLALFLHHEFFRAWQVADIAGHRFQTAVADDPEGLTRDGAQLAGAIAPILDFNRLTRGVALATAIEPVLRARIHAPGFRDDRSGSTGYALRMLGDLCLRADQSALALACFETAIGAGDNPFRRRKAIEAAHMAGNRARLEAHLDAFRSRGPLPADLARLTTEPRA
ncbi:MAG: hypothetical protein KJZ59_02105 [Pararhodobacter sp.]|nr:hypothetical protein [Pararhodobacter sp.]